MITGNKGEWSEVYALIKLIGDKKLTLGDKHLNRLENIIYPILKIIRTEFGNIFEYSIEDEFVLILGGKSTLQISTDQFKSKAKFLLGVIKTKNERSFAVPEIEKFMHSINCITLKADSTTKTDITIVIHDQRTNQQPSLGFSIKSQLGSPSTLLNAGKTTNFIYQINNLNLTNQEIDQINRISTGRKIKDRIEKIRSLGGTFKFLRVDHQIFSNNLVLIDSLLPEILATLIFDYYSTDLSKIYDLINKTSNENPIGFNIEDEHKFYEYKIKRFLTDIALGMMPSKVWTGKYDATGGYLIVKDDGDILCYHIYDRNQFEEYLLNNTKLETASSSRHGFGFLYEENEKLFFKLNLQIRFIK